MKGYNIKEFIKEEIEGGRDIKNILKLIDNLLALILFLVILITAILFYY